MSRINVYTHEDGEAFKAWLEECGYRGSYDGMGIDDAIFFVYQYPGNEQNSFWFGPKGKHTPLHAEFHLQDEWYEIQKFIETQNKNIPHIIDFIYGY